MSAFSSVSPRRAAAEISASTGLGPALVTSNQKKAWIYRIALAFKNFDPNDYDCNDVSQAHHFVDRVGDSVRYLADYNAWIVDDEKTRRIDDFVLVHDLFDRACVAISLRRG